MTEREQRNVLLVALAGTGVLLLVYRSKFFKQRKIISKLAEEALLRTQFINWLGNEGLQLSPDELAEQWQERASFLNLTSQMGVRS